MPTIGGRQSPLTLRCCASPPLTGTAIVRKNQEKRKLGRNDPCPCGSGLKFKRCHGAGRSLSQFIPQILAQLPKKLEENKTKEIQRKRQQGLGKPIISAMINGHRMVAVNNKIHHSDKWQTFHDFLFDYIKGVLTPEWGNAELAKPLDERHPILKWYDGVVCLRRSRSTGSGKVISAPMTGVEASYLGLAYNLYLMDHNVELQSLMVKRLKNKEGFYPAYYETFVAASLIKAGFELEFENETDGSRTHCEFAATSKKTGARYSVEAKSRLPEKQQAIVANQLVKALKKKADHKRVIFIDVNLPQVAPRSEGIPWFDEALRSIRSKESLLIEGNPAPEAYIFVTNHPTHLHPESEGIGLQAFAEGFRIPDFKHDAPMTIRQMLRSKETHADMYRLMESLKEHYEIPATFNGEIPEFTKGEQIQRLIIGNKYAIPSKNGEEVVGVLTDVTIAEHEKLAYGVYQLMNGAHIIASCPLTDLELAAYRRHPDTMFGVFKRQSRKVTDPIDLFDFVYENYRSTPKEKLLEFMKDHQDIDQLQRETQEELAITYSERVFYSMQEKSGGEPSQVTEKA